MNRCGGSWHAAGAGLDYARPRCRQPGLEHHAALADALAETGVTVQDPHGLLPLPAGTLFIARASGTGTGVTEGDRITESFAPLAARRLGGQCAVYHTVEELPELADACAAGPRWYSPLHP